TVPEAVLVETDDEGSAFSPQVAMDAAGNTMVVWTGMQAARTSIWARLHEPATGWAPAERIDTAAAGEAGLAQVQFDALGTAVGAGGRGDGCSGGRGAGRQTPAAGWEGAQRVDGGVGTGSPGVGFDVNGDAVIVRRGSAGDIWTNRYEHGAGGGTPQLLQSGA